MTSSKSHTIPEMKALQGEYCSALLNCRLKETFINLFCLSIPNNFSILFLLSLWIAVNSVPFPSSHDRDSRSPLFFTNIVFMKPMLFFVKTVGSGYKIKCLNQIHTIYS